MSTHNITFLNSKKKSTLIIPNLHLWGLFQGTLERVRNSRGKRAISVRATEVLLYVDFVDTYSAQFIIITVPIEAVQRQDITRKRLL